MKRIILLLHRYLGIALCLMVAAWCLSGVVMMYVAFPSFTSTQRIASLAPLQLADCCHFDAARAALGSLAIDHFEIDMLADRPTLRLSSAGHPVLLDLREGRLLPPADNKAALRIVAAYQQNTGVAGTPRLLGTIDRDQWTVSSGYAINGPLHKIALGDASGTELYVAARSAQIVQRTTARQRIWNYCGAITHWLYFTPLRQHATAWAQTVIWLSVLGVVLTIAGVYLGFAQLRIRQKVQRWSPYRGLNLWHHVSGVLFGLLVLAWMGSGLLSMNPWGLLQSRHGVDETARLSQVQITASQAIEIAQRLAQAGLIRDLSGQATLQVASATLGASVYLLATRIDRTTGELHRVRLDAATLTPMPLQLPEMLQAVQVLQPGLAPTSVERLSAGDDYYYSDHERDFAPVYRIVFGDAEKSTYYFDAVSGALLSKVDRAARGYRWLFNAVHRWDFSATVRRRPLWDFIMVTLLVGVALCSLTGVVLGFRRIMPR